MTQAPLFQARSKRMMLPYYFNAGLTPPVTGLGVSHVLSANGLYDPDITGTGSQPTGFDQMMVFYEHYTVYNATLTVVFRNYSTSTAPVVYLAARGDVTNVSSPSVIMTTGNTVCTTLNPGGYANSLKELKMTVRVAKFLGADDLQDNENMRGDVSANPIEGVFFHIGAFYNELAAAGQVYFQARVTYEAVFSEPRVITPSLRSGFHAMIAAAATERKVGGCSAR